MRPRIAAIALLSIALAAPVVRAAPIDDLPSAIVTRQPVFSIPFTVPATDPSQQPAEVRLLASGDRGVTWHLVDRIDASRQRLPLRGSFTFRAPADGEYWFAIRTVDRNGQMRGDKIDVPELRVSVDTRNPRLDLAGARGTAGEIVVRWQAVDPSLKLDSLRLEYQSSGNPRWQAIAIDSPVVDAGRSTLAGSATWWPSDASGMVTIRAEVRDLAGNSTVSQAQVDLRENVQPLRRPDEDRPPLTASMNRGTQPIPIPAAPSNNPANAPAAGNATSDNRATIGERRDSDLGARFPQATQWPADARTDLPLGRAPSGFTPPIRVESDPQRTINGPDAASIEGPALVPSSDGRFRPSGQSTDRAAPLGPQQVPAPNIAGRVNNTTPPAREMENAVLPPIGSTYTAQAGNSPVYFNRGSGVASSAGQPARSDASARFDFSLPPGERLRMVNSKSFELDYEVDSIGRSGIAKVELWVTRDGGRSWANLGVDNDSRSPFRTTVDGEGVFGYRMTVQSGSGLGGRPPQSGDLPEVWIGVDLTRPSARLVAAEAGTGDRAGEIVIRYEANDALLAGRPVTLLRSAQPGGPWTTIAAGLDNTGLYSWRFDNTVPDRVYLRLEVRDEAGNIGTFEAADPISLERVLPQGRLRNVRPIGDSARGGPAAAQWQR
jgi:hypothetical protein